VCVSMDGRGMNNYVVVYVCVNEYRKGGSEGWGEFVWGGL